MALEKGTDRVEEDLIQRIYNLLVSGVLARYMITAIILTPAVYLAVAARDVPEWYIGVVSAAVGFWFGAQATHPVVNSMLQNALDKAIQAGQAQVVARIIAAADMEEKANAQTKEHKDC